MSQRHLSEDQLIEACLGVPESGAERHLLDCAACEARVNAVGQMLSDVTEATSAEADAVFPPDRLARQHARILQRIDQDGRPARVIVFPAGQPPVTSLMHPRPATRWVAAAAAAGLILGVLGAHVARDLMGSGPAPSQAMVTSPAGASVRTVSISPEDEFLGQIELAGGSGGPAVLRPIDALTPRAWEINP
jgi:hypothetical protein